MSIEKINAALPAKQSVSFKSSEDSAIPETPSDEENGRAWRACRYYYRRNNFICKKRKNA